MQNNKLELIFVFQGNNQPRHNTRCDDRQCSVMLDSIFKHASLHVLLTCGITRLFLKKEIISNLNILVFEDMLRTSQVFIFFCSLKDMLSVLSPSSQPLLQHCLTLLMFLVTLQLSVKRSLSSFCARHNNTAVLEVVFGLLVLVL